MPPLAAFGLLFWISALSSWLAVRQDAISLAALAVVGGFLAPILTSNDSGNHVLLFSYYALLNAGIFGIAWFKAWRSLNLLGFVFTFLVGTLWGVTRYRPEHFATTEPFLVLFFLFYVAIAVLYALRRSVEVRNYVDAGLVFGTPLVAAGLQSALVRDIEYGMAYSALAMSAVYLVLGRFLYARHRDDIRLLVESFLALGVVFATLAVPLGLDARWTSAVWALEGAAIVWVGMRQQRRARARLRPAAGIRRRRRVHARAVAVGAASAPAAIPIVNSAFVGAVLVAIAGLFSAWQLQREANGLAESERLFSGVVLRVGRRSGGWTRAGARSTAWLPREAQIPAVVALLALTAVAFAAAQRLLRWPMARIPALLLLPALGAIAVFAIGDVRARHDHLFAHGGYLAWPLAVAVVVALLHRFDRDAATAADLRGCRSNPGTPDCSGSCCCCARTSLRGSANGSPTGTASGARCRGASSRRSGSPSSARSRPDRAGRSARIAAAISSSAAYRWRVVLVLWSLAANVHGDGDPAPLPYVPLANPLDLTQAIVLIAVRVVDCASRREDPGVFDMLPRGAVAAVLAALVFVWINAIALRTHPFLVRRAVHAARAVALDAGAGDAVAAVVRDRAGDDGLREPAAVAHAVDRRRGAAGRRGRQAVRRRAGAGRHDHAHRVVHRRGPAAAADRLSRAGAAAQGGHTVIRYLFLVAFAAAGAQAERPSDYAAGVPLTPSGSGPFQRVAVPAAVYEGTVRPDLADLRVFNADGEVVPFAWLPRPAATRERPSAVSLPQFPLYVDRDQRDVSGISLSVIRNAAGTTIDIRSSDSPPAPGQALGGYVLDAST